MVNTQMELQQELVPQAPPPPLPLARTTVKSEILTETTPSGRCRKGKVGHGSKTAETTRAVALTRALLSHGGGGG